MKVDDLKLDGQNARKRSDRATGQLAKSLEEFGAARSVVMDADGVIRAGNGTVAAARAAGINKVKVVKGKPDELVVVQRSDLSGERAAAYAIADNRTSELAEWDTARLGDQLAGFNDFTAADLGFEATDLAELFPVGEQEVEDIEPQLDRAEELQEEWGTKTGQLWEIGEHRLLCGDSTKAEDVERLMGGVKAGLCITDPPYGVKRDKGFGGFGGFGTPIARRTYSDEWDAERPPAIAFELIAANTDGEMIVFGGNYFADMLPPSTHWLVWDKQNTMPTFGDCELAWTNSGRTSVKKYVVAYNGLIGKEKDRFHPTQKPLELITTIMSDYSAEGSHVYDPFLGSGTTMLAAEQLGRRCFGMEISPKYCAVILERMKDAGCEPKRGKDGS